MRRFFDDIISFLRQNRSAVLFFMLLMGSIMTIFWVSWSEAGALGSINPVVRLLRLAGDAVVILLPYWFLPRRWRWLVLSVVWAIVIWTVSSLCYFRFWGKPLEVYSLFLIQNMDSTLLRSGIGLCTLKDLLYPLIALVDTLVYILLRRRITGEPKLTVCSKLSISAMTMLMFLGSQYLATRSMVRWPDYDGLKGAWGYVNNIRFTIFHDSKTDIAYNGCVIHLVKSAISLKYWLSLEKELNSAEREEIVQFQNANKSILPNSVASVFSTNRGKNLILIVVESLNAEVISTRVAGRLVAPTLTAMATAQGNISATDVETQVRHRGSADGQLIINTGLHPLTSLRLAAYTSLGNKVTFPSLVRMIGNRESMAIFSEDAKVWNERNATMNLGFDTVYGYNQYQNRFNQFGADGDLLHFALYNVRQMKQPFVMALYTVSTHTPYLTDVLPKHLVPNWIDEDDTLDKRWRDYLKTVGYFDGQLREFIEALKKEGVYDNTVLAIVSDHSISTDLENQELGPMLFIATNTGVTRQVTRRVGQVDLYPTLLQIMGVYDTARWRGVGTSILDPRLNATYDYDTEKFSGTPHPELKQRMKDAYQVSELILRGNYFKDLEKPRK